MTKEAEDHLIKILLYRTVALFPDKVAVYGPNIQMKEEIFKELVEGNYLSYVLKVNDLRIYRVTDKANRYTFIL